MRKWAIYILGFYILLAFTWWTILLLKRNSEITQLKISLNPNSKEQVIIESKSRQSMIIGEGFVLGISILIGVGILFRSFKKELQLTKNQNNFLLSISHELKSPLTSIKLALDTIRKRNLDLDKIKEINDIAYNESNRLEKLIEELLITTKIESGYSFRFEKIDLIELLKNIIEVSKVTFYDIVLDVKTTDQNITIQGDRILLRSAILNVIENAIKYGNKSEIKIVIEEELNKYLLKVYDKGSGITDIEKVNIFKKFYRVGEENTRATNGIGLGLYLTKLIIDSHKGKISVKQNVPNGSIFIIEFNRYKQ